MSSRSSNHSGLRRDLFLIRRRAWLFIPFFILGVLIAVAFGSIAGDANAVASLQLETVIHQVTSGGDRGLRVFEAEAMTTDDRFKAKVREAAGEPNLDYSRYVISLTPISVADGVVNGVMTVSIKDPSKAESEKLREAWVSTFTREFTQPDGLFRVRFIEKKQEVVDDAEKNFQAAVTALKPEALKRGLPLDELARSRQYSVSGLAQELNDREATLATKLAQTVAALAGPGQPSGAVASAILEQPVTNGEAQNVLREYQKVLTAALDQVRQQRLALSDANFEPAFLVLVDNARFAAEIKDQANIYLDNAKVAVTSAQSDIEASYSGSGGVAGTLIGRVAVVIAITLVFGLIAIYLLEWLGQVRDNTTVGASAH